jgi:hypothetical protein
MRKHFYFISMKIFFSIRCDNTNVNKNVEIINWPIIKNLILLLTFFFSSFQTDGKCFVFTCEKELTNKNFQGLITLSTKIDTFFCRSTMWRCYVEMMFIGFLAPQVWSYISRSKGQIVLLLPRRLFCHSSGSARGE